MSEKISFNVSGVSKKWFDEEFKPDASHNFNDTYILKIIHDHETTKFVDKYLETIMKKLELVEEKLDKLLER